MADVAVTSQQKYGGWTWTLMMFSMNTCIPMFFLGPIGQGLGLNFWQVMWGALVGNLAAVIVVCLNGVEAWAGSLAITMIVVSLAGVSMDMVTAVAILLTWLFGTVLKEKSAN